MKYALSVALLLLMMPVLVLGQVEQTKQQQEYKIVEDYTKVNGQTEGIVPVNLPVGDPMVGDTIAVTTYDYFTNSIMRRQIVQYEGIPYFANMIRGFDPGDPGLRNVRFIYDDGGTWTQVAPFGEPNHTGWPSIDLPYTGSYVGTPILTGHAPCKLAFWDSGSGSFIVSSEYDARHYPTAAFAGDNIFLTNGCSGCTGADAFQWWFYTTADLGGSFTQWGVFTDFSPPINFVETGSAELGFAKSADEQTLLIYGTVDMLSGDGGVAVWDGVLPDSADRIFVLESTDAGANWTASDFAADGDFNEMAPGFHIENFAPLPENFSQVDMLLGPDGNKHAIVNGYGGYFNAALDTLIDFAFPILYRNDNTNGWIGISDSTTADMLPDSVMAVLRSGNGIGQCYPSLAMSEDGMYVYAVWQGPQLNSASPYGVDTAQGLMLYDLHHSISTDGGMSWTYGGILQGGPTSEMYPNVATRLEYDSGANVYRAHIVYLDDATNGCSLFDGTPGDDAYIVYKTFEIPIVGVEDDEVAPTTFAMEQNYPNPFNPSTTINFSLPERTDVSLKVYDMLGREVAELINGVTEAGSHEVQFNASDLASGMYVYTIKAGDFTSSKKMLLLK